MIFNLLAVIISCCNLVLLTKNQTVIEFVKSNLLPTNFFVNKNFLIAFYKSFVSKNYNSLKHLPFLFRRHLTIVFTFLTLEIEFLRNHNSIILHRYTVTPLQCYAVTSLCH